MQYEISSSQTFIMKYIFPILWIAIFGYGTLMLWIYPEEVKFNGIVGGAPNEAKWEFLLMGLAGSATIIWLAGRLKRVVIFDEIMIVSNYIKEIPIPISEIAKVTQNRWLNIRPITIEFSKDTEFGQRITFMPKGFFPKIVFWREDSIVQELRNMAGLTAQD